MMPSHSWRDNYSILTDPDIFDEEKSDVSFLRSKSACFAVFGPPGSGKSTVARIISHLWKCLLITPETVVSEALRRPETSANLKELLNSPHGIPEDVILSLFRKKLLSRDTHHYGYVLDDFPTPEVSVFTLEEQFTLLQELEVKIDFVIILRLPLEDAVRRKEKLYLHSPSGILVPEYFIEETKDYAIQEEGKLTEEELEEEETKKEDVKSEDEYDNDSSAADNDEADDGGEESDDEAENTTEQKPEKNKNEKMTADREAKNDDHRIQKKKKRENKPRNGSEDGDDFNKGSLLRSTKKTTFNHYRRQLKLSEPQTAVEMIESELKKPLDDVQNDMVLFRQLFFPKIPIDSGKMLFPNESLHLRLEDSVEWTQDDYLDYKRVYVPHLENFMASYYPLKVVEIDGNMPLHLIPKLILSRFECMRVQKPPVPHTLNDMVALQSIEEVSDDLEKQFEQALLVGAISPRWKWRRSPWGTFCPVSMFEGQMIPGSLQFATVFLDRLYLLADKDKQEKFMHSPKLYLLPPNPKTPERMVIFGGPKSGRTSLAHAFHETTGVEVLDVGGLSDQVIDEQKKKATEEAHAAATVSALETVRSAHQDQISKNRASLQLSVRDLLAIKPNANIPNEVKALVLELPPAPTPGPVAPERTSFDEAFSFIQPETPRFSVTPPIVERNYTDEEKEQILQLEGRILETYSACKDWEKKLPTINETHPDVLNEIEKVMGEFVPDDSVFPAERYVELIKDAISNYYEAVAVDTGEFFGWVLDNLHTDARAFSLLLEVTGNFRLTDMIILRDPSEKLDALRKNFINSGSDKGITVEISDEEWEQMSVPIQQRYSEIKNLETSGAIASLRIHDFDIVENSLEKIVQTVTNTQRNFFRSPVTDYIEGEEEEQEVEENEDPDEDTTTMFKPKNDDENSEKSKPVGDTTNFCPVALKETGHLWPGNPEHGSLMYKDKVYMFSSPEAKEKFSKDPETFLPSAHQPFKLPPVRIFVVGTVGSGKTTHARRVAALMDAFVINLRNLMIETATPKLQKPPVDTFQLDPPKPYWRLPKKPLPGSSDAPKAEKVLPTGLLPIKLPFLSTDSENQPALSNVEQACADSLTADAALSNEVLNGFLNTWLKESPFVDRNMVFDGFPMYPEDAKLLLERGIFPDIVLITDSSAETIAKRLLPKRIAHWKQEKKKRDDKRFNSYSMKKLEWERVRTEKRKQLLDEAGIRRKEKELKAEKRHAEAVEKGEEPEDEEEEDDDEDDRIEDMLNEEFPEPQLEDEQGEGEDSELEEDAADRIDDELQEKIEQDLANIDGIREIFEEQHIPMVDVNTLRSEMQAEKSWKSEVMRMLKNREHILEKAYPVSGAMAKEMLDVCYKRLGKFGNWCPVKTRQGHLFPPSAKKSSEWFPVIYRQYIYLCSSKEARKEFLSKPEFFVRQMEPRLSIPVRIAVIGPPKSGKTTFSQRLALEIGVPRISIGDAIRYVHSGLKASELHRILSVYLLAGTEIPDTLEILCLEALLRTTDCQARGWVLDGYPSTINKLNLMMQRFIVPTIVFELVANNKTCVLRSVIENMSPKKTRLPLFNNSHVVATRLAHYQNQLPDIKHYLRDCTRNLVELDATLSKWKLWFTAVEIAAHRSILVQEYVERREKKLPAPLTGLCVTPSQLQSRLSEIYGPYCPITFNEEHVLLDCIAHQIFDFIVEYREKYYLFASKEKMDHFLLDPEQWLPPRAMRTVPPREQLAKVITLGELDDDWFNRLGFGGLDSVQYYNSGCVTVGLKYGNQEWMVEYHGKVYLFSDADNLRSFMANPEKFTKIQEPSKRPPLPEHPTELTRPMPPIPFLETRLGPFLVQALLEVAELRPKYPLLGYKESALIFLGNYLKYNDPVGTSTSRDLSAEKLRKYMELSESAADLVLNTQGIPDFNTPGPQHKLFEQSETLSAVRKELESDLSMLISF